MNTARKMLQKIRATGMAVRVNVVCMWRFDVLQFMNERTKKFGPYYAAISIAFVAAILSTSCGQSKGNGGPGGPSQGPPAPVRVTIAEQRTLPIRIDTIGIIEAYSTIDVKSLVGGELIEVGFKEGDEVKEGQVLFVIDPRPYEIALKQREAELARAQADVQQAKASRNQNAAKAQYASAQFERDDKLLAKGMVTAEEHDATKTSADAARAAVAADEASIGSASEAVSMAKAAIDEAKLQLAYCTIKSPISGRTGALLEHKGTIVKANADSPMVVITQRKPIYATSTVPEKRLGDLRERMAQDKLKVSVRAPGANTPPSEGELSMIDNAVDRTTGTIRVKATFANEDDLLWPGQFVDVTVSLGEYTDVIVVPSQAIQAGQKGTYVYVLNSDSTAELRYVKTGATVDGVTIIEEGVKAGETVVSDGQVRLAPGATARIIKEDVPAEGAKP
jgi:multidrug efflux system membrane fusion protein